MRSAVELEPTDNCRFAAGSSRTLLPHSSLMIDVVRHEKDFRPPHDRGFSDSLSTVFWLTTWSDHWRGGLI